MADYGGPEKKTKERSRFPDYKVEQGKCVDFLSGFQEGGAHPYAEVMQRVANRGQAVIEIRLDDVYNYKDDLEFVENIERNTRRYLSLFGDAVDTLLPEPNMPLEREDVFDVLAQQRKQNLENPEDPREAFLPKMLRRRYELHIIPRDKSKHVPLREVKAEYVGHLVKVRAVVTRISDVKPLIRVATYSCDVCGHEVYQEVDGPQYTPLKECISNVCKKNQVKGKLYQTTRGSKFLRYQKCKLQELPGEVPVGHVPRSLTVVMEGCLTRKCTPGDVVTVSGIFLVTKQTGFRGMRAGLTADTYIHVMQVVNNKKTYDTFEFTEELEQQVEAESQHVDVYSRLAKSIAPEIFGHDDVKKALLLLLVGAPTRSLGDGMKIRGDINILLMGDPGVAKSQLLKHISTVAPRGVYTTGKGSSGVGLTAAVIRDPVTHEMTLEGGALVLADMGICCIDEFDKMEEGDRTAIYEVMEQQTVSIAKAGITTTLNARTSVLAAANPKWGRYDPSKTPEANIDLPTALLSRFDLTFVLMDKPDADTDKLLAAHVTHVHRTHRHPPLSFEPFGSQFLRAYVSRARRFNPVVPKDLTQYIVGTYVQLRAENQEDDAKRQRFCTARSLLSILRLAQGLARLRFSDVVEEADVVEASRLLFVTKEQVMEEDKKKQVNVTSQIFQIIQNAHRQLSRKQQHRGVRYAEIRAQVAMRGLSEVDLRDTLQQYQRLDVLAVSADGNRIHHVASR